MRFIAALVLLLPLLGAQLALAEENPAPSAASNNTANAAIAPAIPADAANTNTATDADEETPEDTPENTSVPIYLVARVKLTGTDLTQVIFFHHSALATIEACEAERNAGLTTGWNYFSLRGLKTPKGVAYKVDYLCVQSERRVSFWDRRLPMDKFYFVRTTDKKLVVESQPNFFACRNALRASTREESIDAFCGLSSQAILITPPPTALAP